jgi:hypothetical protein
MLENRRLMIGGTAAVIALVVIGAFLLFRGDSESKLTIASVPNDLTLTLDGHPVPANGDVTVKDGEHTLVGERRGFESQTQKFTAKGDAISVKMYLWASGPEGAEWAKNNPGEEQKLEEEAGRRFDEIQQTLVTKYPIIKELPYVGDGFELTRQASKSQPLNPEAISVQVDTYYDGGKANALKWITGHGWDPATLDIIWTTSQP